MYIYELRERLVVARSVIAHLKARKETRWHSFAENLDYPNKDNENFNKYVNSRLKDGEIEIILRDLVEGAEHMSIMIDKKQMYRLRKMLYGMSGKSYKRTEIIKHL